MWVSCGNVRGCGLGFCAAFCRYESRVECDYFHVKALVGFTMIRFVGLGVCGEREGAQDTSVALGRGLDCLSVSFEDEPFLL